MATIEQIDTQVRLVTEEESDFFFEHGWVRLRGLITPELAGTLLSRAKSMMGAEADTHHSRAGIDFVPDNPISTSYRAPSADDSLFHALTRCSRIGENIARLLGRDSPIRLVDDAVLVKRPADAEGTRGAPTLCHQDGHRAMTFGLSMAALWIALDEMTPEQGPMNFFDRSYQLGTLGRFDLPRDEVVSYVPQLARCEITETPHMYPGDATVHHALTVHLAPGNTGTKPRWAYRVAYLPGDARFSGLESGYTRGLGVAQYDSLEDARFDENFPLVYTPEVTGDARS